MSYHSFDKKTLVNGCVVAKQSGQKLDNQQFKASKSETFDNGRLVDKRGAGFYSESTHCKGDKELIPPESETAPPPLPPKRRHVAVYMDLVRPASSPKECGNQEESSARSATLASYVIERQMASTRRSFRQKACSFQFSVGNHPGKRTTFGGWQTQEKASNFLSWIRIRITRIWRIL